MADTLEQALALFGKESFRPLQRELIECALAGRSCIGVLPTGSGKSLCYQIPAVLLGRLTVVVSPLIALMKDQVEGLSALGISAARYDSSLSDDERAGVLEQAAGGGLRMLFVAPESLVNERLRDVLGRTPLGLFVIDEAHCLSEWGHSFRPDYLALPGFAAGMEFHAVMALTATATERVRRDLAAIFNVLPGQEFCLPPTRANIARRVVYSEPESKLDAVREFLSDESHVPSIVYASARKDTEELAAALVERGINARAYHAGMSAEARIRVQDEFLDGNIPVLVATIAFGMGIDKPDVRSVVHYHLPSSPESYVQESGRAGRDGLPSSSLVLYHPSDRQAVLNRIRASSPDEVALSLLLGRLLARGLNVISYYGATTECDVAEPVLNRILFDLEREGSIATVAKGCMYYKVKPLFPLPVILSGRDEEERRILSWLDEHREGEIMDVAIAAGLDWKEAADLLEDLIKTGEWQVTFRQRAVLVRAAGDCAPVPVKTREFMERFTSQMEHEEERLDRMVGFLLRETCLSASLDEYFGFPGSPPCGACGQCAGDAPEEPAVTVESPPLDDGLLAQIAELAGEGRQGLSRAHQMARFLLGFSGPSSLRNRLWGHPLYGVLSGHAWDEVFALSSAMLGR